MPLPHKKIDSLESPNQTRILALKANDRQNLSTVFSSLKEHFECFLGVINPGRDRESDSIEFDITIIFPMGDSKEWLHLARQVKQSYNNKPCIIIIRQGVKINVDEILAIGIDDAIIVSCKDDEIVSNVHQVLNARRNARLKRELLLKFCKQFLVGCSQAFHEVLDKLIFMSNIHSPVLISGETGTGKELFARAIHYLSQRAGKPFIPLNCGALHEHLFENELFGHVKGAYTGAGDTRSGMINEAKGGTLFLDEVNTLSPSGQVKLLRFLEDKTYRKLGSSNFVEADVRIISATNANLDTAVRSEKFRDDLLYRINVLTVDLPPLRSRHGDIPLLARHFLTQFSSENNRSTIHLSDGAVKKLSVWRWPGNVRELRNVIEKAAVMCTSNVIRDDDISIDAHSEHDAMFGRSYKEAKDRTIEQFEKEYLARTLSGNNWNVSQASRFAQMSRQSFHRLIKKYKIEFSDQDGQDVKPVLH